MAASEFSITDVFPMRKRRAIGLGLSGRPKRDLSNSKLEQTKSDPSVAKTPVSEKSSTSASSRKTAGKSPLDRNAKQPPLKTPTRLNFSPTNALGRLRKTPQRLAAWGNLSPCDSGPEIIWDNDSHSPTLALNQGRGKRSSKSTHNHLDSIIQKISSDNKKTVSELETNLFDVWMKKDDAEIVSSRLVGKGCKKKRSFLNRTKAVEIPKPSMQRITRKRSRIASSNAVKIQEELSNFVKDINEKDANQSPDEASGCLDNDDEKTELREEEKKIFKETNAEIAEKGTGKSTSKGELNENLMLEGVEDAFGIADDDSLLDFEEFPIETHDQEDNKKGQSNAEVFPHINQVLCKEFGRNADERLCAFTDVICESKCEVRKTGTNCAINHGDKKGIQMNVGTKMELDNGLQNDDINQKKGEVIQKQTGTRENGNKGAKNVLNNASPTDVSTKWHKGVGVKANYRKGVDHSKMSNFDKFSGNAMVAVKKDCVTVLGKEKLPDAQVKNANVSDGTRISVQTKNMPFLNENARKGFDQHRKKELVDVGGKDKTKNRNKLLETSPKLDNVNFEGELIALEDKTEKDKKAARKSKNNDDDNECEIVDLDDDAFDDCFLEIESGIKNQMNSNESKLCKQRRKPTKTEVHEKCDEGIDIENDLDGIDLDDCSELMNDCLDDYCTASFQGEVHIVENKQKGSAYQSLNAVSKGKDLISTAKCGDVIVNKVSKYENTNAKGKELRLNTRDKGLMENVKGSDLISNTKHIDLDDFDDFDFDIDDKMDDDLVDGCLFDEALPDGFEEDFDIDACDVKNGNTNGDKSRQNNNDVDVDVDLEDWDEEMIVEDDLFVKAKKPEKEGNVKDEVTIDSRKIINKNNGDIGSRREAKEIVKKKAINNKDRKRMDVARKESINGSAFKRNGSEVGSTESKLTSQALHPTVIKPTLEAKKSETEVNHSKKKFTFRSTATIKKYEFKSDCGSLEAKGKTMEYANKKGNKNMIDPDLSVIANEDAGQFIDIKDDRFWGDDSFTLTSTTVPFTSTQKAESASTRNGNALLKSRKYTPGEIERKKAEAKKRLELKRLEGRQNDVRSQMKGIQAKR